MPSPATDQHLIDLGLTWPQAPKGHARTQVRLNIRYPEPSTAAPVLGVWSVGKTLLVWSVERDWWLLQCEDTGLAGWSFGAGGANIQAIGKLEP